MTSIGERTFSRFEIESEDEYVLTVNSITEISLPSSVISIGESAFEYCTGLTSLIIPEGVTSIGDFAFCYCTDLTSITIPEEVTSIGVDAFYMCGKLTEINVNPKNANYSSHDGVLYNKDKTVIIFYPADKTDTSFTIPDSVTSIGRYAFYNCTGLTGVTIPGSVTSIGYSAFDHCTGLTSVTIPDSVTSIDYYAFRSCTGLTSVTIPDSVTSIDYSAFRNCKNLTDVYYTGSENQWNNITIGYYNDSLTTATIHYNWYDPCFTVSDNTVTNTDSAERTADIIIPKYTDGVFAGFEMCEEITFAAGETKTFTVPEGGKLFVWDSLDGMRPLTMGE